MKYFIAEVQGQQGFENGTAVQKEEGPSKCASCVPELDTVFKSLDMVLQSSLHNGSLEEEAGSTSGGSADQDKIRIEKKLEVNYVTEKEAVAGEIEASKTGSRSRAGTVRVDTNPFEGTAIVKNFPPIILLLFCSMYVMCAWQTTRQF